MCDIVELRWSDKLGPHVGVIPHRFKKLMYENARVSVTGIKNCRIWFVAVESSA